MIFSMKTLSILIVVVLCTIVSASLKGFNRRYIKRLINRKIDRALDQRIEELMEAQMDDFTSDIEELIESKINDPVLRTFAVNNAGGFYNIFSFEQPTQVFDQEIDRLVISDPASDAMSENNLFAYRPNFNGGGIGAFFFNIQGIFPCLEAEPRYNPLCYLMAIENESFNGGRAFLEVADEGEEIRIFSFDDDVPTYGIGVQECSQIDDSCWPTAHTIAVTCQLPRQFC